MARLKKVLKGVGAVLAIAGVGIAAEPVVTDQAVNASLWTFFISDDGPGCDPICCPQQGICCSVPTTCNDQ